MRLFPEASAASVEMFTVYAVNGFRGRKGRTFKVLLLSVKDMLRSGEGESLNEFWTEAVSIGSENLIFMMMFTGTPEPPGSEDTICGASTSITFIHRSGVNAETRNTSS